MNDINQQLKFVSIFLLITVFFVYIRSFVNDVPSCNGYITNVYLYVLLGLLITALSVLFIAKRRYPITSTKSLLFFAISIIALIMLFTIDPRNVITNHAVWLAFIISASIGIYLMWKQSQFRETFSSTMIITLLIVAGLTIVAHLYPGLISLNWGSFLTIALFAGILAWIVPILFNFSGMSGYYKFLSGIFVVFFMFLILYDTKELRIKAEQCTVPDYPKDSIALFLDIVNLFGNVSLVQG